MKLRSLIAIFLTCFTVLNAQNTVTGIVNDYTPVLSFSNCDSSLLQVGSSTAFSPDAKVLIIQMKGATVNLTNTVSFGNIINSGNAGNYEFNRIKSISGNQISLLYKIEKNYNVSGKVQLIRVPEYNNVTADALTCKPWDGATGGVLAIDVAGTLTLQGAGIDVSASGFRGGVVVNANDPAYHQTGYFFPPDANLAAQKGEGIVDIALNQSYGCGKAANGGGGGNAHNAGGGGGGNAGAGGNGGLEYYNTPSSPTPNTNGRGGVSAILNNPMRIIMGGGGGAGHANDNVGSSGGKGGGIVILRATTIAGNNKHIAANGENIFGPGGTNSNDGQGGGGGGGTIVVDVQQISSHVDLEVKGGRGGDCLFYVNSQIIGPGGGGGGGRILFSQTFPNISSFLLGGQNGIANQNLTNQAQPGGSGLFGAGFSTPIYYEDTILAGFIFIAQNIDFCPGSSVTIGGITYDQPGTVVDTIPGVVGCDTVITYNLQYAPLDLVFAIEDFYCANGSLEIKYSLCNLGSDGLPGEVSVFFSTVNPTTDAAQTSSVLKFTMAGSDSCKTGTVTISGLPVNDVIYSVVNFNATLPTPFSFDDFPVTDIEECNYLNNLDSFLIQLPSSPTLDLGTDVVLCVDSTVVFDAGPGFLNYLWQDGSSGQTIAVSEPNIYWVEATDSCGFKQRDSVLLTVSLLPDTQFSDMEVCVGKSVGLSLPGFDIYHWSPAAGLSCTDCADVTISPAATTTYTLLATTTDGCVLRDTFMVIVLAQPALIETIAFCKGDTVFIGGTAYTQPGMVVDTIPASVGCDTIATYNLQYLADPNAIVSIDCIDDISIATQSGTGPVVVHYALPTTATDCPCPGIGLALTEGLPSGSLFPITTTKVCYQASDSCGNTAKCCFNVTVREELPCDVKEIGCMKYELLDIKRNATTLQLTYRIRVTDFCANKMIYTAIQIPDGMVAEAPANNSIYTSEDGREYDVRNPNFSPFYSIRFKSTNDSISNGNSDIFEYTLPPQADVDYIQVTSRLYPQIFYEAHLNTFNCPIEIVDDKPGQRSELITLAQTFSGSNLKIFPNPTGGAFFADLSDWKGEQVHLQVFDSRGQRVQQIALTADAAPQEIQLPKGLANGLYFLEVLKENGEKQAARIVLQR